MTDPDNVARRAVIDAFAPGTVLGADAAERYLRDWRGAFSGPALAVVRPGSTEEVAHTLRLARDLGLAVVPQGGNTGLAGGATPRKGDRCLLLSLERMIAIEKIDPVGMTVRAGAGVIIDTLREALRAVNRDLPISFGASGSATLGGVLATNAGGANVLRYGMAGRMVLSLEAVLPDGTVLRGPPALHKNNAGLNWPALFVGSEGTFGVITSAALRIQPLFPYRATAFVDVPDARAALRLYARAQDMIGDRLSAFEFMSRDVVERVGALLGTPGPCSISGWAVLIESEGAAESTQTDFTAFIETAFAEGLVQDGAMASSNAQREAFWRLREAASEAEAHAGPSAKHDISVPVTAIPDFIAQADAALMALDPALRLHVFGHIGDGNLHYNVIGVTPETTPIIVRAVHDAVAAHGGSISAEHGIGQYRIDELYRLGDPAVLGFQERLKDLIDPDIIMNPGKVLRRLKHGRYL